MVAEWRKSIAALLAGVVTWSTAIVVSPSAEITSGEVVAGIGILVGVLVVALVPNAEPSVPQ